MARGRHKNGATIGIRTRDLILTMDALYQLSYRGITLDILTDDKGLFKFMRAPDNQSFD